MAKATKRAPADYAVGRGKPPAHSRFRPGQSGNPGGRKKGSRNLKSVLEEVMREEIELTENGKKRSVSLLEALIKRAVQEGLRGDLRAIKDLLDRYERHVGSEPEIEEELPDDDKAILQRMLALRAASRTAGHPRSRPGQDHEYGSEDDDE
jgi:Family of unknown function (DUF5681)